MSAGETFLLVALLPIALVYWGTWFHAALSTRNFVRPGSRLIALGLCFVASLGIVLAILLTAADPVVRENVLYIILFLLVAAVALAAVTAAGSLIGISALDDAVRRPNVAAVSTVAGIWIGTSLTVAGANIGRGDTIGTTNGPLILGVATLIALWIIWAAIVGTSIVQDRDVNSGIRFAGLFVAWGLILGRATAGDWESVADTLRDFAVQGSPVVVLLLFAIPIEFVLRPNVHTPRRFALAGLGPATFYVASAIGWVLFWGKP